MQPRTIDRITSWITGLALPLVLLAFALGGAETAIGAAAGAALSVVNWLALCWLVRRMIGAGERARAGMTFLLVAKMGAVLALAAWLLRHVDGLGLAIGMGGWVLGVLAGSVHARTAGEAEREDDGAGARPATEKT